MMTNTRLVWLALLFALILPMTSPRLWAAGTKPNPVIFGTPRYLLFGSTVEDTRGFVYEMDDEGHLRFRQNLTVGYDVTRIGVSPNGRTVVYSAYTTPTLSVFHVRADASLSSPTYLTPGIGGGWNPVTFHPSLPLFYVGTRLLRSFMYDSDMEYVAWTGESKVVLDGYPYGGCYYSPWSDRLIISAYRINNDWVPIYAGLTSVQVTPEGVLGDQGTTMSLPVKAHLESALSPDGRWLAMAARFDDPQLMLLEVGPDGSFKMADTKTFGEFEVVNGVEVKFSPDGRRLYLLSLGDATLISYGVDPQTGKLTELARLLRNTADIPCPMDTPIDMAIAPDGRYIAFRSISKPYEYLHNWINIVRLGEDGSMKFLLDCQVEVDQYVAALAIAPIPVRNAAEAQWALYE